MPTRPQLGIEKERALVHFLERRGWRAFRVPASGSVSMPDVIAFGRGLILAIEVKASLVKRHVYIEWHQLNRVLEFARAASQAAPCIPLVAVYFGKGRWVFKRIPEDHDGTLRVKATDESDWTP